MIRGTPGQSLQDRSLGNAWVEVNLDRDHQVQILPPTIACELCAIFNLSASRDSHL